MTCKIFRQLTLFQDFTPEQIALVEPLFSSICIDPGTVIFEQGDPAEYLYLVVEGEVIVRFKPDDGPPLVVAHVHPEGVVGWSAALGTTTYTSAAVSATPCKMLRVLGVDLRALCEEHPMTGTRVLERLASKITERVHSSQESVVAMLEQGLRTSLNNS
jgi:CRP/FNR family transcriptional regulator, cyclic AMP receptor protein